MYCWGKYLRSTLHLLTVEADRKFFKRGLRQVRRSAKECGGQSPEKGQAFLRQWLLYLQPSSLYNLNGKFPMLPLHSPHGKAPHLHASKFSSNEIFHKITSVFLKTGINLRNLPPAHSRGAVTFSGLWWGRRNM